LKRSTMTSELFQKWRRTIADELVAAYAHYHIWEQLWPSEESVKVLNQYRVFFHYTTAAHIQLFLLRISKITEDRRDSVNFWRLLDEIEKAPSLAPGLSKSKIKKLRQQLQAQSDLLRRIRTHRDKRIAHVDSRHSWPDDKLWQDKAVTVGEAKVLLEELENIFNTVSSAHDGQGWSLKTVGLDDTGRALRVLLDH